MNLQTQPNSWSCLPTSLAILLNEPVEDIIKEINSNEKDFHIQSLNKVCLKRKKALIEFDMQPEIYIDKQIIHYTFNDTEYVEELMKNNIGILLGQTKDNKNHAVSWDGEKIYDPNGTIYARGFFTVETFLMLVNLK